MFPRAPVASGRRFVCGTACERKSTLRGEEEDPMNMADVQSLLNTMMRGIDKKTVLTIEEHPDAERPGVTVHLSRNKRTGTLEISEADLLASQSDLMRRNRVRTALKRARDRMWEETGYIFSTKVERQKPEGMQFFRPVQGGRGRR
jgi:hypothetical protein